MTMRPTPHRIRGGRIATEGSDRVPDQNDPRTTHGEHEDLFRLLVESVKDYAIFLLDPNGFIRSWNAGAARIKGYSAEEIIGKHFSTFYPPQEVRRGKPEY